MEKIYLQDFTDYLRMCTVLIGFTVENAGMI